jgi:hypothetical protein
MAEGFRLKGRERAAVAWSSVVPDFDGAGVAIDWSNRLLRGPETTYYEQWHHALGHGLPAAVLCLLLVAMLTRSARVALLAFASFHLHLLMDVVGSRGSNPFDIWAIPYLAPLSDAAMIQWSGQWPLTGWQNTTFTVLLMVFVAALAVRRGESVLVLFSRRADRGLIEVLRRRLAFLAAQR